jgi:hypothetical protein
LQIFGKIWYQLYAKPSFAAAMAAAKAMAATAACTFDNLARCFMIGVEYHPNLVTISFDFTPS